MRKYWIIFGVLAMGFFLADALVAMGPNFAKGDWYTILFFCMATLAGIATWAGAKDICEAPQIFGILAIFMGLFSFGPVQALGISQAVVALAVFVVSLIAWFRQPAAPPSLEPRQHPFLNSQTLPWFWTIIAGGLGTFFCLDAGSFALQQGVKTPANVIFAFLFLAMTVLALVLAWRRVANVAALFSVLSILCIIFSANLGPYQIAHLSSWQFGGGIALFILSLFGAVTVPARNCTLSTPPQPPT